MRLNPIMTIFLTKSMTLEFTKKLPTRGNHYKAILDPELTLPEGLLPDLPDELTHHWWPVVANISACHGNYNTV